MTIVAALRRAGFFSGLFCHLFQKPMNSRWMGQVFLASYTLEDMRQQAKEGRRNGFSVSAADQDHAGRDAECREARGLDVDRAARGAYHVRTEWCPDDGGDPGDGDLLYVAFKAFACAGGGEPGGVVAASFEVSVLRAWDAEALGPMSGVSSGAGAATAGGCGALPRVRAGV